MPSVGWTWNPVVMTASALLFYFYFRFARWLRPERRQMVQFVAGMASVWVALVSPLHQAADRYLFTLHVVQHMLLQMVAPILLVLAIPHRLLAALHAHPAGRRALRWAWSPATALVVYNGVLALWHFPFSAAGPRLACGVLTDLPLQSPLWATLQDGLPLLAGLLFWGAVLVPPPFSGSSRVARLAMLFPSWVFNWVVSFANATADKPFYGTYAGAPRLWGLSPMDDQMLGAGILWEHGNMTYVIVLVMQVVSWLRERQSGPAGREGGAHPRVGSV